MLFNGFVVSENVVNTLKSYNEILFHGKVHIWGMKCLHVYHNMKAKATIDEDPVWGTKYMVTCVHTDGHVSTSTFFDVKTAENYMHEIVGGFYAHTNNIMGIEVNFKSYYSF